MAAATSSSLGPDAGFKNTVPLLLAVNAMKKAAIVLVLLQVFVLSARAAEPKECSFCAGAVAASPASPIPLLEEITLDDFAAIDAMTPAQRAKTVVLIRYALDSGKEPKCSGEDGRAALEIAIAMRESHRQGGRRIDLPLDDRGLMIRSAETLHGDLPRHLRTR